MTTTFIIVYIVIALILIGLINVLFQNQEKAKDQKVEQRSTKDSENQSYQSKFKASDLDKQSESNNASSQIRNHSDNIEDDKRKHHFETTNEGDQTSSKATNANSKYDAYPGSLRRSDQHEDQANDEKQDHQKIILNNLMKNQMKF